MRLYRERQIQFGKDDGYIKEYDQNGNLSILNKFNEATIFSYEDNKLIREKTSYGVEEEWKEIEYYYNPFGYRKSEFKVEQTGQKTILIDTDIVLNNDGNIISRKVSNYLKNETNLDENIFSDKLLISEKKYSIVGNEKKLTKETEFKYDNQNRIVIKKSGNKRTEFEYSENQIIERYYENGNIFDEIVKLFDSYGNLIKVNNEITYAYIKEYNPILKKSFLVSVVEADITDNILAIRSNTIFEYIENPFDITKTIYTQKK